MKAITDAPPPGADMRERLREARDRERTVPISDAIASYESVITSARAGGESGIVAEALRRLAVLCCHRAETDRARDLCTESYHIAHDLGNDVLAAEALNTLGGLDLMIGALSDARRTFLSALALGGSSQALRARVEQNLGILANIQGELDEAQTRYRHSLEAYRDGGDERGCAIAYHNLGMVSADRGRYREAEQFFEASRRIAGKTADRYLDALCLVNQAEVDAALQRYENARQHAAEALVWFERLGAKGLTAEAHRVLGTVYRETGRHAQAEVALRRATEVAERAGSVLAEAEGTRELALLYQEMGRNYDALRLLNVAYGLFQRLEAHVDLVDVGGKVAVLEGTYREVIRAWGRSIEARGGGTHGHCERVSELAVTIARVLDLGQEQETTILLGAYLHDVGKLCVPLEVLEKRGPLSSEELALVRTHPALGVSLLEDVAFPWDIKPIIRWHHERCDGTGYPDGLTGEQVPVTAQIVGIAEVFDALTAPTPNRGGLPVERALEEIRLRRHWWSDRVFRAFESVIAR